MDEREMSTLYYIDGKFNCVVSYLPLTGETRDYDDVERIGGQNHGN